MSAALGAWLVGQARELGFDDAALVRADQGTPRADDLRRAHNEGRLDAIDWLRDSVPHRADLQARYPQARTVLVVALSYWAGDHDEHDDGEGARVSRYAWGGDYHTHMRKRLRRLRKRLLAHDDVDGAQIDIFNDVDPVSERAWAEAAGMGFIGKSAMFIHRGLGTWTFLGGLITDLDLDSPPPLAPADLCGSCTACLQACPTDAFPSPGVLDVARCLTTWNVERADDERGDKANLSGHGWAFGCDVCQQVCPWNRFASPTRHERYRPLDGHVRVHPDAAPEDLAGTPLARVGKAALARSAGRALKVVSP